MSERPGCENAASIISLCSATINPFATCDNSMAGMAQTSKTFLFWFTRSKPLKLFFGGYWRL